MTEFWPAFWPNLASTLLGILIGVPLALWINRRGSAGADAQRQNAVRAEIAHTLETFQLALTENRARLRRFAQVLAENKTLYDTGLDTSTWEALQGELTAELRDPQLRRKLAYHFSRTAAVVRLNETYLGFLVGVESNLSGADHQKQTLGVILPRAVGELEQEAEELIQSIPAARARLAGAVQTQETSSPEYHLRA